MAHVSPNRESQNPDAKTTIDIAQSSLSLSPFKPNEAKGGSGTAPKLSCRLTRVRKQLEGSVGLCSKYLHAYKNNFK